MLLESVPNVSEGRDLAVIAAVGQAFAGRGAPPRRPLRCRSSPFGLHAGRRRGRPRRRATRGHRDRSRADRPAGARGHPSARRRRRRRPDRAARAAGRWSGADDVARALGRRVGEELGLPVFLYGASGRGRRPAFFRRGGPAELQRRLDAGELRPDFGPARLDPRAGGALVGARAAADRVQHRAPKRRPGGRAGDRRSRARVERRHARRAGARPAPARRAARQVSLNVIDVEAAPPRRRRRAGARGRG